ncbi:hypothetical protein V1318_13120 [Lysobacter sp. CCNWLW3]|uniref:hypothetical protein n=1 Tax=unclassified Lysobacter TaxID=2635362 RepID=UPI002FD0CC7C
MHNAHEERYVFYRSCHADFSEALRLLEDAEELEDNNAIPNRVSGTLQRYAVVVYFRPFTRADTTFAHPQHHGKNAKKICLGKGFIPAELLPFHDELRTYRDSAYAHTDIAIRNPRLHFWRGGPWEFPIAISPPDKKPLHIHRDKMKQLCATGLAWLNNEIKNMEEQFRIQYRDD